MNAVLISDLHIGGLHMPPRRVGAIVARINDLHPDVVFLAGDYIGGDGLRRGDERLRTHRSDEAVEVSGLTALGGLKAPLGVYAVMGNHDCYWDCAGVRRALGAAHIRLLENEAVPLQRGGGDIWVEGIEDGQTQKPDFRAAAAGVPRGATALVIVHNPGLFDWPTNDAAIQLSGHTHAGQVRLPIVGAPVRMSAYTEDTAKGWTIKDGRILVVTRGLGESGLPVRLNAPPQIMRLTIRPGASSAVSAKSDTGLR